ncbi:MAG: hypothetical protein JO133_15110 [Burkholderiaceae bacterium]|nr:hypothetical protein [Burkholderiaceae bacterium]
MDAQIRGGVRRVCRRARCVGVLINRLLPRPRKFLVTLGLTGGALFTGVIGTLGAILVWEIAQTDQVSEDMGVPM